MKKQIKKIPEIKSGVPGKKASKTINRKEPVKSSHKEERMDEDDWMHKQSENVDDVNEPGKERDIDDMIHEQSGYMPGAEDDNEYFDDEDLDDLTSER